MLSRSQIQAASVYKNVLFVIDQILIAMKWQGVQNHSQLISYLFQLSKKLYNKG